MSTPDWQVAEAATVQTGPVLVPLDGSTLAERALPWAAALALRWHAPLLLARVVSPIVITGAPGDVANGLVYESVLAAEEEAATQYLQQQVDTLRAASPALDVKARVGLGDTGEQLLKVGASEHAQVIVLTTHGRGGLARWVRGSVAEKLLRYGTIPLLLLRPWDADPASAPSVGSRVLVPLDGSRWAEQVLDYAIRLAAGVAGEIVLVTVASPEAAESEGHHLSHAEARSYLHGVARRLREQCVSVRTVVASGPSAAQAIVAQAARDASDVIAMTTHGRGGIGRLRYGSVADLVAHEARVPVLLVHPQTTVSPTPEREAA